MSFDDVLQRGEDELLSTRPRHSLSWILASQFTASTVTAFSKLILTAFYNVELKGLNHLDNAFQYAKDNNRAILTIANHMSTCDDPMLFACLPWRYFFNYNDIRWGLAASNICFTNKISSAFFSLGRILPCERFGRGPFQPSIDACIRLLSPDNSLNLQKFTLPPPILRNKPSWVHIFPEGFVCQLKSPHENSMRYFRWGTARLVLEPTIAPVVIPIFADGFEKIRPEEIDMKTDYLTPSNIGSTITVNIGKAIDDNVIKSFRDEWKNLCNKYPNKDNNDDLSDELKFGSEARDLRSRVCDYLREQVAQLRLQNGFREEDPRFKDVNFWKRYTLSRGNSDPDIQFVGLNWAIKEYQRHVKLYNDKGEVIGEGKSERPSNL